MSRGIAASFWRGGTSRGLIFRASTLSAFSPTVRNRIVRTALGSPDPGGRQIDGLGGGASSLSKVCIVGVPGEGRDDQRRWGNLEGVEWADQEGREAEWDVVYRFAQVGVKDDILDWSATCGNMMAAVALYTLQQPLLPYTTLFTRSRSLLASQSLKPGQPLLFPLKILSAANGQTVLVNVPLDPVTLQVWDPPEGQGTTIAGVPGEAAGVEIELPIQGGLVTGQPRDIVKLDGLEIPISIITTGLPNIFLSLSSLFLPSSLLTQPASLLSSHPTLLPQLEQLRLAAAAQYALPLSLASPKITLVGPMPSDGYDTSGATRVEGREADLIVRAVSSGEFHATVPGTTLGALNLGAGIKGTVIWDLVQPPPPPPRSTQGGGSTSPGAEGDKGEGDTVKIRAAHKAGVAESCVRFEGGGRERKAKSVVMMRTAREIMRGEVLVPEKAFEGM